MALKNSTSDGLMNQSHNDSNRPKLGLALGGGAAKGWSHIGVLRKLTEIGIKPDVIAGTSIGSVVGAAYLSDHLDDLEKWVISLSWADVVAMLDIKLSGGLIKGEKVIQRLRPFLGDLGFNDLNKPFAVVAADLETGSEVWLREGEILEAIRASIAIPPLFAPVRQQHRWLVDGGLVNPVPVSLCRAMGADVVIAVDLSAQGPFSKPIIKKSKPNENQIENPIKKSKTADGIFGAVDGVIGKLRNHRDTNEESIPSFLSVAFRSLNIMTTRITRSRMAGEPAELVITPKLSDISLMEFHRAKEAIEIGYATAERHQSELENIKDYLVSAAPLT